MGRQGNGTPRFAAHLEHLEERKVMAADPMVGVIDALAADAPLVEQTLAGPLVEQSDLGTPDFWIDPAHQISFDEYFDHVEQALAEAHRQTGWLNVRNNYGFTGRGQTIAVIDSGIAWDHFALGGGLGAGYRVVGGWDFTEENDGNPYDDGPSGGHGTHVSGIIGGSSPTHSGVAPGVDFVSLRVFNDAGSGYFNWVENALRWVHENRNNFANPITTVNLSLGVSSWNADTIPTWATLEDEFAQLAADGIFVAVAAGNAFASFGQPGLSYPAASSHVVPVMSTDDSGLLSYFSQRHGRAIAAPGAKIISTVPDYKGNNNGLKDDFATMSGTSMAAPYVAGAAALVRQAMEFIGRTGINQDLIFDHLMATADTLFDAATSLPYKRLNLERAIEALMPQDDYGSTMDGAYDMGALTGSMSMTGSIARIGDVDYFTFTAGATGRVTFAATGSHDMRASWQVYGVPATASGDAVSFNVTAGNTYTVSLASSGGLGHYSLDVTSDSAFSYADWGAASFNQWNDVAVSGERWYCVQATRDGTLTVQAEFGKTGGAVHLELYDANLQRVAVGQTAGNTVRVDARSAAGAEYFVRITGTNGDVDFTLVNLVSQTGSTVRVAGTSAADRFALVVDAAAFHVGVGGVVYQFSRDAVTSINFSGGAGTDMMTLIGSAGHERATFRAGNVRLEGEGFVVDVLDVEQATIHSRGGNDSATFFDTAGNDLYRTYADRAVMTGSNYYHNATGFATTRGYASAGVDWALMYDSSGDDEYVTRPDRVIMSGAGYRNEARGFDTTYGYASGGYDAATMYDSTGDDVYRTYPDRVIMSGAGYFNNATGFDATFGYASRGKDWAWMYDSAGDDEYQTYPHYVIMSGARYVNSAAGFPVAYGFSSTGKDRALMYDSAGNDLFRTYSDRVVMSGVGYFNNATNFPVAAGFSSGGADQAQMYDSAGDDSVVVRAGSVKLTYADARRREAHGFSSVVGRASSGGRDEAYLEEADSVFSLVGEWVVR